MNKLYTLITFLVTLSLSAQTLEFTSVDTLVYGANNEEDIMAYATVKNISDEIVAVRVRKEEVSIVEGSINYFCWDLCFEPPVFSSGLMTLEPEETNSAFIAYLQPHGNNGMSTMRYCFTNNVNTDEHCIDITFNVTPVSVEKVNPYKSFLSNVYPNPAVNSVNINYNLPAGAKEGTIVVYNAIGIRVKEISLNKTSGVANIDVADLQSGIYNAALVINGKLDAAKRFVIKH
jgi:hypothetical protein